jgi:hypothetical protein
MSMSVHNQEPVVECAPRGWLGEVRKGDVAGNDVASDPDTETETNLLSREYAGVSAPGLPLGFPTTDGSYELSSTVKLVDIDI